MSRIIRGKSNDIKSMRVMGSSHQVGADGVAFNGSVFKSIQVEGLVSVAELDERIGQASNEGLRAGLREAEARMSVPVRSALENIENVLDELSRFRRELFKEAENEVLDLIRAVAKKVVVKEISLNPDDLKRIVEKALELLEKQKKIVLQIHPSDYQFYMKAKADFLEKFKGIEELEIVSDSQVLAGTVIIRTKTVQLDLNLESMVDHLLNQATAQKKSFGEVNDEGDKL